MFRLFYSIFLYFFCFVFVIVVVLIIFFSWVIQIQEYESGWLLSDLFLVSNQELKLKFTFKVSVFFSFTLLLPTAKVLSISVFLFYEAASIAELKKIKYKSNLINDKYSTVKFIIRCQKIHNISSPFKMAHIILSNYNNIHHFTSS